MKRICLLLMAFSSLHANNGFSEFKQNSDAVYRTGTGASEGAATSLGASMLAWGLGLTVGIAVIAGVLHQSKGHAH